MDETKHNYTRDEMRDCINDLLNRLDKALGEGIHANGSTPDWFVYAAAMGCDIPRSSLL